MIGGGPAVSSLLADARTLFQRRTLPDGDWDTYTMTSDGHDLTNVTADPNAGDAGGRDDVDVRGPDEEAGAAWPHAKVQLVGGAGFEPATSCV